MSSGNGDLVLGAAVGFDIARVRVFVESLRGCGYRGDILLLVGPLQFALKRYLARHGVETRSVVFTRKLTGPIHAFRFEKFARIVAERRHRYARVLVSDAFDAADDWIAEHAGPRTIVVTGDILLADRCIKAGATVIAHTGKPFDAGTIGAAIATRAIMADLRAGMDGMTGGPRPFAKADRSRFLQALDQALVRAARVLR